ncbi:MAG: cyclic nucleotide-binding/CBS domain-containing protein, partial [Candidatus Bathyarchaeia archaeon]
MSSVLLTTTVKEVMEKDLAPVDENTSAAQAVKTMVDKKVWSIVVTSKGLPVGVMTERDCIRRCIARDLDHKTTPVSKLMSSPLITVLPDTRVGEALSLMVKKQIRRLYVVDDGKVVGRVTQTGVLSNTMEMFKSLS